MVGTTGPSPQGLRSLAATFSDLGRQVETSSTRSTLQAIVEMAAERLPAAAASVTTVRRGRFATSASTDDRARGADGLQYRLGSGPCVDAIRENAIFSCGDLAQDERWPEFGPQVVVDYGFCSLLAYRLSFDSADDDDEMVAALNVYGDAPGAFDEADQALGLLLSTHAAIALVAATERDRSEQLRQALDSNRDIGVAMGVLMTRHQVTREQAFDLLRISSQETNRKLRLVAQDVAETGTLMVHHHPRPQPSSAGP